MSRYEALVLRKAGYPIASSFIHWEGYDEEGEKKGRFVKNFSERGDWCTIRSHGMESH